MEILVWLLVAAICYKIAEEKNRNSVGWFIGGFLFSFIALILILLLPKLEGDIVE